MYFLSSILFLITVTEKEVVQLLQRYSTYDNSEKGLTGMSLADCLSLSEFSGDKCIAGIVEAHLNEKTRCIHPKSFLNVCSLLSSKTSTEAKKDCEFKKPFYFLKVI